MDSHPLSSLCPAIESFYAYIVSKCNGALFLLYMTLMLFSNSIQASFFSEGGDGRKIVSNISYLESDLPINSVKESDEWILHKSGKINFGFSDNKYWVKLNLVNPFFNEDWFLTINNTRIDYINFYLVSAFNEKVFYSGDHVDIEGQLSAYPTFIFKLPKGHQATIYIEIMSGSQIEFEPILRNAVEYGEYSANRYQLHIFYFFIFLLFILSQSINIISGFDKMIFYYTSFLIFSFSYLILYNGDGNLFFWPGSTYLKNVIFFVSASLSLFFFVLFIKEYIRSRDFFQRLNKAINIYVIFSFICIFIILSPVHNLFRSSILILEGTLACLISFIGIRLSLQGKRKWSFLFSIPLVFSNFAVLIYQATFLGFFPHTNFTSKILLWSLPLDILLISIGFIYRHILLKEENEKLIKKLKEISSNQEKTEEENVDLPNQEELKQGSRLGGLDKETIISSLTLYLDREKAYLEPRLSLEQVASNLEIRPDQLSAIINSKLNTSFSTLINLKRLEEATRLLQKDLDKSILDISLECGFGSKSSFNRQFKLQFGKTPTEYRKTKNMEEA